MSAQNTDQGFTLPSFAKINLLLRVVGLLPDGYHELETVFQTIELHDLITFRFEPADDLEVHLEIDNPRLPSDGTNLIHRACVIFDGIHPVKARIHANVQKRIPVEGGLGGGSSNAAVTLIALSRFLGWPVDRDRLAEAAASLGADVPFFLHGGTALGRRKGDQIQPIQDATPYHVLLVHPGVSCSTAAIYRKYDEVAPLTARSNFIKILSDQRPEPQRDFVSFIENDLENVVFTLYPELDSIKKQLLGSGAAAAALAGSGSTLFGLFAVDLERAAREFPASTQTRFVNRAEYEMRLSLSADAGYRMPDARL